MASCAIPLNGQTWLICGGRHFDDAEMFADVMGNLMQRYGCPEKVIQGGAPGADAMGNNWALRMGLKMEEFKPLKGEWPTQRNQRMIDKRPDKVIAFPGGNGTADCIERAKAAGIEVVEIKNER